MTRYLSVRNALLIALLCTPFMAQAQKFQEPSKEELQMTSDPKAPGASAVILYREAITDNFNHFVSEYDRIKVFSEAGKKWATVKVRYAPGYNGKPIVQGRTIHPDGTVSLLKDQVDSELALVTRLSQVHEVTFTLPDVTPGSILEYRWTRPLTGTEYYSAEKLGKAMQKEALATEYSASRAFRIPQWDVQQDIYVHKEHFYFNPLNDAQRNVIKGNQDLVFVNDELASYIVFTEQLPANAHVMKSPKDDYTLDIEDVPAMEEEAEAPPEDSLLYRVRFYFTQYPNEAEYWLNEQKRWSKQVDALADSNPDVASISAQLTAATSDPEAKAHKLYDAVQQLENTTLKRYPKRSDDSALGAMGMPSDVWNRKSGTANEIALLYLALARAAGLDARALQVADRGVSLFNHNNLSLSQLQRLLVVIQLNGRELYLDPGEKLCPFGQLAWEHSLSGGIGQKSSQPIYTPPNNAKDAITAHTADLTLDAQGSVSGTAKMLANGPQALFLRQLNATAGAGAVQEQLRAEMHRVLPNGLSSELGSVQGLDSPTGFVTAVFSVRGSLGTTTGKRLIVPGFVFSSGTALQFTSEEKRTLPVDLHYAGQVIDDVVYHAPAGYAVESAPQATQLAWPDHAALVVKTQPGPGTIDIKRIFARGFVILDPKEYPALRDYYQKLATNDQQQVVFAPAGN
ncbi:MAG: DUF3857 domain-containing protein [Terracidiphilus sp.]|nr:DUF3857 domain-containing protein [Terracidiphilus sp.]